MKIDLPDDAAALIRTKAAAAGFDDDVEGYVAHLIVSDDPAGDPRGGLGDAEVRESLDRCDEAMAEYEAGNGRPAGEALREVAAKHGIASEP